jgi:hypothetical protein
LVEEIGEATEDLSGLADVAESLADEGAMTLSIRSATLFLGAGIAAAWRGVVLTMSDLRRAGLTG